jgi:succinoglycan biosynthesis protein ExoM
MKMRKETRTNSSGKIAIGLCTYHRNELLGGALESLSRINLPPEVAVEFILVDNDPAGGARQVFEAHADDFSFKSHYFIEPNQGLVCARNRVLEEALGIGATEIAFFDDDEVVVENWLMALWDVYSKSFVSGVGGPVYRLLPIGHSALLEKFWPNFINHEMEMCQISMGNCLFSANLVSKDGFNLRFDPFFNQIGGEDGRFSLEAFTMGATFDFAKEAIAVERFTEERATFSYLLKRHFGSGSFGPLMMRRFGTAGYIKRYLLPNVLSCVCRTLFIPFSPCFGKFQFWKNLVKLMDAAGVVVGCFGYKYKYYTTK